MNEPADLLTPIFIKFNENESNKNNTLRRGGHMKKLSNETKKDYSHFKDIVIAVLITGVVTFIGGMVYQSKFNDRVEARATQISQQQAKAEPSKQ